MTSGAIAFRSSEIDDLVDTLATSSTALVEIIDKLDANVSGVAWRGSAEQAYRTAQADWARVMTEMTALLREASALAHGTRDLFLETESAVSDLWVST